MTRTIKLLCANTQRCGLGYAGSGTVSLGSFFVNQEWIYWGEGDVLFGATSMLILHGSHKGILQISPEGEEMRSWNGSEEQTIAGVHGPLLLKEPITTLGKIFRRSTTKTITTEIPFSIDQMGRYVLELPEGVNAEYNAPLLPCPTCGHATPISIDENFAHMHVRHCQACTARVPTTWEELELGIPTCHRCDFPTEQMFCQRCGEQQSDQGQVMRYGLNIRTP